MTTRRFPPPCAEMLEHEHERVAGQVVAYDVILTTDQIMVAVQARVINPAQPIRPIVAALISLRSSLDFTSCTPTSRLASTRNKLISLLSTGTTTSPVNRCSRRPQPHGGNV
jgi:hypothetical protein